MDGDGTDRRRWLRRRIVRKLTDRVLWGIVVVAVVVVATQSLLSRPSSVLAQPQDRGLSDESLISHTQLLADGTQQLCVVDPRQRVVAIYHIDPLKGGITLRSVRNIYWDLRINHFNGTTPLPEEIRSLIEQE